ncbi:hypothetical protein [Sphingomonas sp.]|jgi:hypothetical protein|uniref:hypothetical protein n=1 Tax=Sphingomonas sp. TaxID=28214 RepID=UPI003F6FA0F0
MADLYHLYERVQRFWPETISLDVAVTVNGARPGVAFTLMSDLLAAIESRLGDEKVRIELEIWAFHMSLWKCAKRNMRRGTFSVSPSEVSFLMFAQRFELELKSWGERPSG